VMNEETTSEVLKALVDFIYLYNKSAHPATPPLRRPSLRPSANIWHQCSNAKLLGADCHAFALGPGGDSLATFITVLPDAVDTHSIITIPVSSKQISISRAPLTPLVSFFTTNAVSKYHGSLFPICGHIYVSIIRSCPSLYQGSSACKKKTKCLEKKRPNRSTHSLYSRNSHTPHSDPPSAVPWELDIYT